MCTKCALSVQRCTLGQAPQVCQPHSTPVTPAAIRNTIQKYDLKFKNSTALLGLPKAKKWSLYGECCTLLTTILPSMTALCVREWLGLSIWHAQTIVPAYNPYLMQPGSNLHEVVMRVRLRCLHPAGPQNDTFGLHDFVAYNLSRAAGDWAPHTIFTEASNHIQATSFKRWLMSSKDGHPMTVARPHACWHAPLHDAAQATFQERVAHAHCTAIAAVPVVWVHR